MTLRELVDKYEGEVSFVVGRLISGGVDDIVEFSCADCEAIKDDILDGSVSKYSITTSTTSRITAINVVLEEAKEAPSEDTGTETDEETGTDDENATDDTTGV